MSYALDAETNVYADGLPELKSFSCLACRQRKVRCDKRDPCCHCIKANKQCVYIAPVRGKRKRTKAAREGLHARLRRYEELLRSCGVAVEPSQYDDENEILDTSPRDTVMNEHPNDGDKTKADPFGLGETNSKLVTKEESTRYFDG